MRRNHVIGVSTVFEPKIKILHKFEVYKNKYTYLK